MDSMDQLQIDTPEQIALELPLAGIGSRFLAFAIDTLLQAAVYVIGGIAFALLLPAGTLWMDWIPRSLGPALAVFFLFCVYWGYFAIFETVWKGQTPGKKLAGIRVIKESGRPIQAFEAIGRNLMRAVDGLPGFYGVGVVCMMLNKQNRRLGDFVAGTVVVHEKLTDEIRPAWSLSAPDTASLSSPLSSMPSPLAQVTAEELVLIETYLHRRWELDPAVRIDTAIRIAERIKLKAGLESQVGQSVDDFLEAAARQIRDSARFGGQ